MSRAVRLSHEGEMRYHRWLTIPTLAVLGASSTLRGQGAGWRKRYPRNLIVNNLLRPMGDNALRGFWAERLRTTGAAFRRGVPVVPGTDENVQGQGPSLQFELEFFAEAGIPPLEVLKSATLDSARVVGADKHIGSPEAGKLADLIQLDANPLDDIRNTQKIWRVFKGGWQFDPKVLRPGGN